jgi:hypothetical protein
MLPSALQWHPASEPEQDLLQVLVKSRNCSASDPRDKVYAVLSLVEQASVKSFVVDYSTNLEQVYMSVAKHLVLQDGSLNILKHTDFDYPLDLLNRSLPSHFIRSESC